MVDNQNQNSLPPLTETQPAEDQAQALHKRHFRSFWPIMAIAVLSAIVGGLLVWALFNQGLEEEINSLLPGKMIVRKNQISFPEKESDVKVALLQPKDLPDAHNEFGFDLLKKINKEEKDSIFISPTSISLALSMVYSGANGQTKEEMAKAMHLKNLDTETLNKQNLGMLEELESVDPKIKLDIANSVWFRQGVEFKADFFKTVKNYYRAEAAALNFSDPSSVKTINNWVSNNTNGKIPAIISSTSPETVMYLINAVYFKGEWQTTFDKNLTQDRDFTASGGQVSRKPMMRQKREDFKYFEEDGLQSVRLPYGKNDRLAMYVFLPENIDNFVQGLDRQKWDKWLRKYQKMEGTLLLPKFKFEYTKSLNDILKQLGISQAFTDSADFSGLREARDIYISQVMHKTFLEVNEEGTEAAAVTNVTVGITSLGTESKIFYMEVNRPFFFVIRDDQTGENLFVGAIKNLE